MPQGNELEKRVGLERHLCPNCNEVTKHHVSVDKGVTKCTKCGKPKKH